PIVRAATVHPDFAFLGVMVRERKMRSAVAERFAHLDALRIERIGDASDRGLRAFLVDVPAFEMFDWTGVHDDQGWMDDRARIHQRPRQSVTAWLDRTWKCL